jgi:cobyrinic acid a,c-diamide synthase
MRAAIRSAVADGLPTVAECGGFLYLHKTLEDDHGQAWPMAGVLDQGAWNGKRLGRFGYVTLTAERDGLLCPKGARLPAHEFHYWESGDPGGAFQARKPQSDRGWRCGWHSPTLYAGFPHFHFCGAPEAAGRFVAACAAFQTRRLPQ